MCGTAVVATDIGGHREFCIEGETALMVIPGSPDAIAEAAGRFIRNSDLRLRVGREGHRNIQKFTWDAACDAFERVLTNAVPLAEQCATAS